MINGVGSTNTIFSFGKEIQQMHEFDYRRLDDMTLYSIKKGQIINEFDPFFVYYFLARTPPFCHKRHLRLLS